MAHGVEGGMCIKVGLLRQICAYNVTTDVLVVLVDYV